MADRSTLKCVDCSSNTCDSGIKRHYSLEVPYNAIARLEQARNQPSDQTVVAALYAALVGSLFSGVIAHFAESQIEIFGPAGVGGAALVYYFFVARPRSRDNYLLLFLNTADKNSPSLTKHGL